METGATLLLLQAARILCNSLRLVPSSSHATAAQGWLVDCLLTHAILPSARTFSTNQEGHRAVDSRTKTVIDRWKLEEGNSHRRAKVKE